MIMPPAILVVGAILVGLLPHLGDVVQAAAVRFQDQAGYRAAVLSGAHLTHPVALYPAASSAVTLADVVSGVGSAVVVDLSLNGPADRPRAELRLEPALRQPMALGHPSPGDSISARAWL